MLFFLLYLRLLLTMDWEDIELPDLKSISIKKTSIDFDFSECNSNWISVSPVLQRTPLHIKSKLIVASDANENQVNVLTEINSSLHLSLDTIQKTNYKSKDSVTIPTFLDSSRESKLFGASDLEPISFVVYVYIFYSKYLCY